MTTPSTVPPCLNPLQDVCDRPPSVVGELVAEHGTLVRRLARLQQRVTEQLQAGTGRQAALEAENLRLRCELVRMRTAVAWNLRTAALLSRPVPGPRRGQPGADTGLHEAQAVICQTGCVGHAHPWLDAEGQCRRTGRVCDRLEDDSSGRLLATPPSGTAA